MNKNDDTQRIFITEKKDILQNSELRNLVKFKLNKNNFNIEDLLYVKDIILDSKKINGDINLVYFDELDFFPNLEKICLKNLGISKDQIQKLLKIKEIEFQNCQIFGLECLKGIKKLSISSSKMDNLETIISNLYKLEELELINIEILDYNFLKDLKNLKVLKIKNIKNFQMNVIDFELPIEYLSIEKVKELNINNLMKNYKNLRILSVDMREAENFKNDLQLLQKNNIKIMLNEIYEY